MTLDTIAQPNGDSVVKNSEHAAPFIVTGHEHDVALAVVTVIPVMLLTALLAEPRGKEQSAAQLAARAAAITFGFFAEVFALLQLVGKSTTFGTTALLGLVLLTFLSALFVMAWTITSRLTTTAASAVAAWTLLLGGGALVGGIRELVGLVINVKWVTWWAAVLVLVVTYGVYERRLSSPFSVRIAKWARAGQNRLTGSLARAFGDMSKEDRSDNKAKGELGALIPVKSFRVDRESGTIEATRYDDNRSVSFPFLAPHRAK